MNGNLCRCMTYVAASSARILRAATEMRGGPSHDQASQNRRGSASRSRRAFLVGTAATGLVLGYAAPKSAKRWRRRRQLSRASGTRSARRQARDRQRRQGRHGPAHRQHHGADRRRRTRRVLEGHARPARSNDPKYNDPVLGAQVTGGSWSTMMNFDAMSRAGAAGVSP